MIAAFDLVFFFFSSRRRHTRYWRDWSSDVCSSDLVLAVIRGTAINHDGRSAGLTVPNGLSQQSVIRLALQNGGVAPEEVGYVEAHGTGTPLGDPIEIESIGAVYGARRAQPLLVGSVKTNLGHLEAAAGIAGLMKVVLMLQHGRIPPHLHFERPTPRVDWSALPIRIPVRGEEWRGQPRIAGVSSFGFSGTNAHVVLEEGPATSASASETPIHLLTLSARTPEALGELIRAYGDFLARDDTPPLADVCFTANTGRAAFGCRAAFLARTKREMRHALLTGTVDERFIDDENQPAVEVTSDSNLESVARLWVGGARLDWREFYERSACRKVALPTYPFQRQRYWIEEKQEAAATGLAGRRIEVLTLDRGERLFEYRISETSPAFLSEHRINGVAIFPATASLELALAASGKSSLESVAFERT